MIIGNGCLNMNKHWRDRVSLEYYDTHYFFGPEIHALYKSCKFDDSDKNNELCKMGLKLADQVKSY